LQEVGGADAIGPILLGLNKPVHVLQLGSSIRSIFNVVLIAVVDAQTKSDVDAKEAIKVSKWWKGLKNSSTDI
jgi:malate dehydrogenase (oxaloacetate-decarboxylating)(NADP+)